MRRSALALTVLLPCLFASVGFGIDPIRIDDTTILDPIRGTILTVRPEESLPGDLVPAGPRSLRRPNDGFAGCSTSDNCAPFDLDTHVAGPAIGLLPEGNYPYDATLNPAGTEVWIPGASGDGVIVIDRATNTISHRIAVGEYPVSIAFSKDGSKALVPCRDTEEIKIISTTTYAVTDSLSVPTTYLGAGNIALDPVSGNFYLVDWYGDDLYEIAPDGSAILNQVTLGNSLWQLVVSPDGQDIYVTDRGTDQVRVIDPGRLTQVNVWSVGDDPWGIDITEDGDKLVVACEDSHEAYVIETGSGAITALFLDATADPRDVDILDDQETAYVAGGTTTAGNLVYRIDLTTDTVAGSFPVTGTNVNVVAVQAQAAGTPTGVGDVAGAGGPSLNVRPNPFDSSTSVRYFLTEAADVRLAVYDVVGRVVRSLDEGRRDAGRHVTSWDGRDDRAAKAAAGIYFLGLEVGGEMRTQKVVRVR
jgi:YVTN family beta-propeller protein